MKKNVKERIKSIKYMKSKPKGITLVALVVTIVVLLILAGITINMLVGNDSIFNKAQQAKEQSEITSMKERLVLAKTEVFLENEGKFDVDKYFDKIIEKGLVLSEDEIVDNGDGTYEVTTVDGYVFDMILIPDATNPTDILIEYVGIVGKLPPKIGMINVTAKDKTSISIRISARLEGGEVKAYYKKASEVAIGETESDVSGYTEITLDGNLAGTIRGLTAGETYKIKAILTKDGTAVSTISIEEKTTIIVTSITLNKETTTITVGKTETLTVETVLPANAEDKSVTWSSNKDNIATVDQTGKVTGVAVGEATITATASDGSGVNATCIVTVKEPEANWAEIAEWAEYIATHESEVSGSGENKTAKRFDGDTSPLQVGDSFKVYYGSNLVDVEIIDFLHDDLADGVRYTSNTSKTKAGITFDFKNCIGTKYGRMNESPGTSGGWASSNMRNKTTATDYLTIPDVRNNLSTNLKSVIKTVKKGTYKLEAQSTLDYTDDDLWLLSVWEVFGEKKDSVGQEGTQYAYYTTSSNRVKTRLGSSGLWWLRSPHANSYGKFFCYVTSGGTFSGNYASLQNSTIAVVPGFCI